MEKDGTLVADIEIPKDSPWFDGHFPGQPVLPGIAQLAMVQDLLRAAMDNRLKIKKITRVRFKQMIRPDDGITIIINPGKSTPENRSFRILKKKERVCTGFVEFNR